MTHNQPKNKNHQQFSLTFLALQDQNTRLEAKLKEITKMYDWMLQANQNQVSEHKQALDHKLRSQLERRFVLKEESLKKQIFSLNKQLIEMSENYESSLDQRNKLQVTIMELKQDNQNLSQRDQVINCEMEKLQRMYQQRQLQVLSNYSNKIQLMSDNHSKEIEFKNQIIQNFEEKINQITNINSQTEDQYEKIKDILEAEMKKRKSKQEQYRIQTKRIQKQLKIMKENQTIIKRQLAEKLQQNLEKDSEIYKLQKTVKQLEKKMQKIENENKKQLNKQKIKTQKAIDGLNMVRKYSQIELNKSKKKQKGLKNDQKSLILKIKEISGKQKEGLSTTKSSRKFSTKNELTHQKSSIPSKQNYSPSISSFMLDEETLNQVDNSSIKENNDRNGEILYLKDKIETPHHIHQTSGTPCFENQLAIRNLLFRRN